MLFVTIPLLLILGLVIFEHFSNKPPFSKVENKTTKPMTREERLKICENCRFCERDIRGMVCGKTNEYADFEGECKEFDPSEKYVEQKKIERMKKVQSLHSNDTTWGGGSIADLVWPAVGMLLPLVYSIKDGDVGLMVIVFSIYIDRIGICIYRYCALYTLDDTNQN